MNPITLVIPAAGLGSRFRKIGIDTPKPLIQVLGVPMLEWVISNFPLSAGDEIIIIGQRNEALDKNLSVRRKSGVELRFLAIDGLTSGPATTVSVAFPYIHMDRPLIVANSDQFVSTDLTEFVSLIREASNDGLIMTMKADGSKWSYVGRNSNGDLSEVKEKIQISDEATVGIYAWRKARFFQESFEAMVESNDRVNNEFYVAPTYNYLINKGLDIQTYHVGLHGVDVHGLGTPEDLESFLSNPSIDIFGKSVSISSKF